MIQEHDGGTAPLPGDEDWMRVALDEARQAAVLGEVPVGAVLVRDGVLLASGCNQPILLHDPTAHAEIVTLRRGGQKIGNYRLPGTTLYVTLEPCAMCVGALVHARVSRLVFGAREPKAGAVCSSTALLDSHRFNWRIGWTGGLLAAECGALVSAFFSERRRQRRTAGQERTDPAEAREAPGGERHAPVVDDD